MEYKTEFDRLNKFQKIAVFDDSEACIVNAHVGSGKTTVLISKIIYLHYEKNIQYNNMIVLTFTNKAANEIIQRLQSFDKNIIKEELAGFGTFHSVALNLLKDILPIENLGFTKEFVVIDPDEELDLAMELIEENRLTIKYKNRLKKRLEKGMIKVYEKSIITDYQDDINILVHFLKEEKKKQNKLSFFDLIDICINLLSNFPIERKWIIVDEVQDSDKLQVDFINKIKTTNTQLFAVGDPNQVIYSWRSGKADVFKSIKTLYSANELTLPINYRSCLSILEVAKCFLYNESSLVGIRDQGSRIIIKNHYNPFNEAEYLTERIIDLHQKGVNYSEIAIFYRFQIQSHSFEEAFSKRNIPYEVSLKKTIRDIPVLSWLIKIFRFSINNKDKTAAINVLVDNFHGESLSIEKARCIVRDQALGTSNLFDSMILFKSKCTTVKNSNEIYDYFEFDNYIRPTSSTYEEDKKYIFTLLDKILDYTSENNMSFLVGLEEFMNSYTLYGVNILIKDINSNSDSVKLMTLHASKGLEFKYVFIVGVNYGLIPMYTSNIEGDEEEKRLFFVGITRAKDYLELSYYTNPEQYRASPGESRYINMIPLNLVEKEVIEPEEVNLQQLRKDVVEANKKNEIIDLKINRKVRHVKYGIGTVINEDEGNIIIDFEGYGQKEFVKAFSDFEYIV